MKALKEYFTRDRVITWALIILAVVLFSVEDPAASLLCWIVLELRDINEALEDKK